MLDDIFRISREFLKIFQRPYERYFLTRHPFESRFSIVTGQRGVGKTTVMIQKIMSMVQNDIFSQNALYVPVDHFMVGGKSLYAIAEAFYNLGGEIICFDEIHKHADWSGELKSIYDSMPNLTLMASGSSALEIQKGSHDLSRRAVVYSMSGLSFREYLGLAAGIRIEPFIFEEVIENHERIAGGIIDAVEREKKKILALFKMYLKTGYFPYFLEFGDTSLYFMVLEQGIRTTIESDLLSIYPTLNGSSIKKIKRLLSVIAESVPFTPDMKRLKRIVEIGDERTLKNYLKYLEDGGIITLLTKTGTGSRRAGKAGENLLEQPEPGLCHQRRGQGKYGNHTRNIFYQCTVTHM